MLEPFWSVKPNSEVLAVGVESAFIHSPGPLEICARDASCKIFDKSGEGLAQPPGAAEIDQDIYRAGGGS